jgi:hypothetical protein
MLSPSVHRVQQHTSVAANRAIHETTQQSIAYFKQHPREIRRRLSELDREWDVERALATGSSCLTLLGLALGRPGRRAWLGLSIAVQGFYLQHTFQGWCPPLPVFRQLGFRTPAEIDRERYALKDILRDLADAT